MIKGKTKFLLSAFEGELGAKPGLMQDKSDMEAVRNLFGNKTPSTKPAAATTSSVPMPHFDWSKVITIIPYKMSQEMQDGIKKVLDDMASDENGIKILEKLVGKNSGLPIPIFDREDTPTGAHLGLGGLKAVNVNQKESSNHFVYNDETNRFYKGSLNNAIAHELAHIGNGDLDKGAPERTTNGKEAAASEAADKYVAKFGEPKRSKAYAFAGVADKDYWQDIVKNVYSIPPQNGLLVMSGDDKYDRKYISDKNNNNLSWLNDLAEYFDMSVQLAELVKGIKEVPPKGPKFDIENAKKNLSDMYQILYPRENEAISMLVNNMPQNKHGEARKQIVNTIINEPGIKLEGYSLAEFYKLVKFLAQTEGKYNISYEDNDKLAVFYLSLPEDMRQKVQKDIDPFLGK